MEYDMESQEDYRCRLCLKNSGNIDNLFILDSKYKAIIENFTGLQIKITTDLPSMICNACVNVINILLEFKETCIKSQEILEAQQNIVKFQEIPTSTEYFENNLGSMLDIKIEDNSEDEEIPLDNNTNNSSDYSPSENEYKKSKKKTNKRTRTSKTLNKSKSPQKINQNVIPTTSTPKLDDENEMAEEIVSFDEKTDSSDYWPSDDEPEKSKKKTSKTKTTSKTITLQNEETCKESSQNNTTANISGGNEAPKKESKQTPCYICGKMIHRLRMQLHLNIHYDIRPYKCKVQGCNKAYPSPRELRQHNTYNHNKEEPFECDICKRRYKTNAALRMHKTYHSEPKIPCDSCGKLFRNNSTLKQHMFNHFH